MRKTPLRAFLMLYAKDGKWAVTVCRDLGSIMYAWKSRNDPKEESAILHIGFDRLPSQAFEKLAISYAGRMLLTKAAKHALPSSFVASNDPVGFVEECAVFLGLKGWGYSLEDPTISESCSETKNIVSSFTNPIGWVALFVKENPSAKEIFLTKSIFDDGTYLRYESNLDKTLRYRLGLFRISCLVGDNCNDPCRLARVAPPWLTERELHTLGKMPVRACNVFEKAKIRTVQDLSTWSSDALLTLPNCGQLTLQDVLEALNTALKEGLTCSANHNISKQNKESRTTSEISKESISNNVTLNQQPQGWVASFLKENTFAEKTLLAEGIINEETYLKKEFILDRITRHQLGLFRIHYLAGSNCNDPCVLAKCAPPWLTERELTTLEKMPVRVSNVFEKAEIKTVQDLSTWSSDALIRLRNFGRSSLQDVLEILNSALNKGPIYFVNYGEIPRSDRLLTEVQRSFSFFTERERDILVRRLGFETTPETLQEIATSYEVTRERIRQIEKKTTEKWIRESYWDDVLEQRITRLIIGRNFPLPVAGIEAIDQWFEGISSHLVFFRNLVKTVCKDRLHLIKIDELYYFSLIDQDSWEHIVSEARVLLSSSIGQEWNENYARSLVQGLLPSNAKEFGHLLWDNSSKLCLFTSNAAGSRTLTSYGRAAEQLVEAILTEAELPLHYSEIAERSRIKLGKELEIRRAHNAAANVGFLFDRGTYGLSKHLPFSNEEMQSVLCLAEDIVCLESPGRQWHTSEILSELSERLDGTFEKLNKYLLDIILSKSTMIRSLKRMTWDIAGQDSDEESRIDIHQAVIAIVKDAGRPLARSEIKGRLLAVRGVGDFFQIHLVDPLIRVQPGVWGIKDRDVPLSRSEQQELVEELVVKLHSKQSGIHTNELSSILDLKDCSPDAFLSIAIQDDRVKQARRYIYLKEWGHPRRKTIAQTILDILEITTQPISLDEIVVSVEKAIGRKCERTSIYHSLRALEASFDNKTKTWSLSVAKTEIN